MKKELELMKKVFDGVNDNGAFSGTKSEIMNRLKSVYKIERAFGDYEKLSYIYDVIPTFLREDEDLLAYLYNLNGVGPKYDDEIYEYEMGIINENSVLKTNESVKPIYNESIFNVQNVDDLIIYTKNNNVLIDLTEDSRGYGYIIPGSSVDFNEDVPFAVKLNVDESVKNNEISLELKFASSDVDYCDGYIRAIFTYDLVVNNKTYSLHNARCSSSGRSYENVFITFNKAYVVGNDLYLEMLRTVKTNKNRYKGFINSLSDLKITLINATNRYEPFDYSPNDIWYEETFKISAREDLSIYEVLYIPDRHRLTMPVDVIEKKGFSNLECKKIIFPHKYLDILDKAFYESNIEEIEFINPKVEKIDIGKYAFARNNAIKGLILPEGVKHIKASAFSECENLEYIVIPSSVLSIEKNAFAKCPKLTIFTTRKTPLKRWDEKMCGPKTKVVYLSKWEYDENGIPKEK